MAVLGGSINCSVSICICRLALSRGGSYAQLWPGAAWLCSEGDTLGLHPHGSFVTYTRLESGVSLYCACKWA